MDRIAFLVEETGEQIFCLLNPESIMMRRSAGVRTLGGTNRAIAGADGADDALLATGGGITEVELELLFDTELAGEFKRANAVERGGRTQAGESDVRVLTRAIWNLAENAERREGRQAPPIVRLIWGSAWNIPGIIVAAAERLERFTSNGRPQRSWLKLRLRRLSGEGGGQPRQSVTPQFELPAQPGAADIDSLESMTMLVDDGGFPARRLDEIAAERLGDPSLWTMLAAFNDIDDPLRIDPGRVLRIPAIRWNGALS